MAMNHTMGLAGGITGMQQVGGMIQQAQPAPNVTLDIVGRMLDQNAQMLQGALRQAQKLSSLICGPMPAYGEGTEPAPPPGGLVDGLARHASNQRMTLDRLHEEFNRVFDKLGHSEQPTSGAVG